MDLVALAIVVFLAVLTVFGIYWVLGRSKVPHDVVYWIVGFVVVVLLIVFLVRLLGYGGSPLQLPKF